MMLLSCRGRWWAQPSRTQRTSAMFAQVRQRWRTYYERRTLPHRCPALPMTSSPPNRNTTVGLMTGGHWRRLAIGTAPPQGPPRARAHNEWGEIKASGRFHQPNRLLPPFPLPASCILPVYSEGEATGVDDYSHVVVRGFSRSFLARVNILQFNSGGPYFGSREFWDACGARRRYGKAVKKALSRLLRTGG
jgi:hypothetical protein